MTYVDATIARVRPDCGCYGIGVIVWQHRSARHITMSVHLAEVLIARGRYTSVQSSTSVTKSEAICQTSCTRICRMQAMK